MHDDLTMAKKTRKTTEHFSYCLFHGFLHFADLMVLAINMTKFSLGVSHRNPINNGDRLCNKTNAEIRCGQTSKQEFGRLMKGRHLAKGIEE